MRTNPTAPAALLSLALLLAWAASAGAQGAVSAEARLEKLLLELNQAKLTAVEAGFAALERGGFVCGPELAAEVGRIADGARLDLERDLAAAKALGLSPQAAARVARRAKDAFQPTLKAFELRTRKPARRLQTLIQTCRPHRADFQRLHELARRGFVPG